MPLFSQLRKSNSPVYITIQTPTSARRRRLTKVRPPTAFELDIPERPEPHPDILKIIKLSIPQSPITVETIRTLTAYTLCRVYNIPLSNRLKALQDLHTERWSLLQKILRSGSNRRAGEANLFEAIGWVSVDLDIPMHMIENAIRTCPKTKMADLYVRRLLAPCLVLAQRKSSRSSLTIELRIATSVVTPIDKLLAAKIEKAIKTRIDEQNMYFGRLTGKRLTQCLKNRYHGESISNAKTANVYTTFLHTLSSVPLPKRPNFFSSTPITAESQDTDVTPLLGFPEDLDPREPEARMSRNFGEMESIDAFTPSIQSSKSSRPLQLGRMPNLIPARYRNH